MVYGPANPKFYGGAGNAGGGEVDPYQQPLQDNEVPLAPSRGFFRTLADTALNVGEIVPETASIATNLWRMAEDDPHGLGAQVNRLVDRAYEGYENLKSDREKQISESAFFPGPDEESAWEHPFGKGLSVAAGAVPFLLGGLEEKVGKGVLQVAGRVMNKAGIPLMGLQQLDSYARPIRMYFDNTPVEELAKDKNLGPLWANALKEANGDELLARDKMYKLSFDATSAVANAVAGMAGGAALGQKLGIGGIKGRWTRGAVGAAESGAIGGAMGAAGNYGRQRSAINLGQQDEFNPDQMARAVGEGAFPMAIMGGGAHMIGRHGVAPDEDAALTVERGIYGDLGRGRSPPEPPETPPAPPGAAIDTGAGAGAPPPSNGVAGLEQRIIAQRQAQGFANLANPIDEYATHLADQEYAPTRAPSTVAPTTQGRLAQGEQLRAERASRAQLEEWQALRDEGNQLLAERDRIGEFWQRSPEFMQRWDSWAQRLADFDRRYPPPEQQPPPEGLYTPRRPGMPPEGGGEPPSGGPPPSGPQEGGPQTTPGGGAAPTAQLRPSVTVTPLEPVRRRVVRGEETIRDTGEIRPGTIGVRRTPGMAGLAEAERDVAARQAERETQRLQQPPRLYASDLGHVPIGFEVGSEHPMDVAPPSQVVVGGITLAPKAEQAKEVSRMRGSREGSQRFTRTAEEERAKADAARKAEKARREEPVETTQQRRNRKSKESYTAKREEQKKKREALAKLVQFHWEDLPEDDRHAILIESGGFLNKDELRASIARDKRINELAKQLNDYVPDPRIADIEKLEALKKGKSNKERRAIDDLIAETKKGLPDDPRQKLQEELDQLTKSVADEQEGEPKWLTQARKLRDIAEKIRNDWKAGLTQLLAEEYKPRGPQRKTRATGGPGKPNRPRQGHPIYIDPKVKADEFGIGRARSGHGDYYSRLAKFLFYLDRIGPLIDRYTQGYVDPKRGRELKRGRRFMRQPSFETGKRLREYFAKMGNELLVDAPEALRQRLQASTDITAEHWHEEIGAAQEARGLEAEGDIDEGTGIRVSGKRDIFKSMTPPLSEHERYMQGIRDDLRTDLQERLDARLKESPAFSDPVVADLRAKLAQLDIMDDEAGKFRLSPRYAETDMGAREIVEKANKAAEEWEERQRKLGERLQPAVHPFVVGRLYVMGALDSTTAQRLIDSQASLLDTKIDVYAHMNRELKSILEAVGKRLPGQRRTMNKYAGEVEGYDLHSEAMRNVISLFERPETWDRVGEDLQQRIAEWAYARFYAGDVLGEYPLQKGTDRPGFARAEEPIERPTAQLAPLPMSEAPADVRAREAEERRVKEEEAKTQQEKFGTFVYDKVTGEVRDKRVDQLADYLTGVEGAKTPDADMTEGLIKSHRVEDRMSEYIDRHDAFDAHLRDIIHSSGVGKVPMITMHDHVFNAVMKRLGVSEEADAYYDWRTDQIFVRDKQKPPSTDPAGWRIKERVLRREEIMHALTMGAIERNPEYKRQLDRLREYILKQEAQWADVEDVAMVRRRLSDVHEFVSGVWADPRFREILSQVRFRPSEAAQYRARPNSTVYAKFINWVQLAVTKMMRSLSRDNALNEALIQSWPLIEQAGRIGRFAYAGEERMGARAAPDMTRLFRAEGPPATDTPEWLRQAEQDSGQAAAYGRWFTTDPEALKWYTNDKPGARTHYIDVPTADLEKYRVSNLDPTVRRFSRDPTNEFFLPRELADQRRLLEDERRGAPGRIDDAKDWVKEKFGGSVDEITYRWRHPASLATRLKDMALYATQTQQLRGLMPSDSHELATRFVESLMEQQGTMQNFDRKHGSEKLINNLAQFLNGKPKPLQKRIFNALKAESDIQAYGDAPLGETDAEGKPTGKNAHVKVSDRAWAQTVLRHPAVAREIEALGRDVPGFTDIRDQLHGWDKATSELVRNAEVKSALSRDSLAAESPVAHDAMLNLIMDRPLNAEQTRWVAERRPENDPLGTAAFDRHIREYRNTDEWQKLQGPFTPYKRHGNHALIGNYEMVDPARFGGRQLTDHKNEPIPGMFAFPSEDAFDRYLAEHENNGPGTVMRGYRRIVTDDAHNEVMREVEQHRLEAPLEGPGFIETTTTGERRVTAAALEADMKKPPAERQWPGAKIEHVAHFNDRYYAQFYKEREAHAAAERMKEAAARGDPEFRGLKLRGDPEVVHMEDPKFGMRWASQHMQQYIEGMEKSPEFRMLSKSDQNAIYRRLNTQAAKLIIRSGGHKGGLMREFVEGQSPDLLENMREQAAQTAWSYGLAEHGPSLRAADKALRDHMAAMSGSNNEVRNLVGNELLSRGYREPNIYAHSWWGKMQNRLLKASYIQKLAGPSFLAINSMEPVIIGLPILAARYGMAAALQEMYRAYRDVHTGNNLYKLGWRDMKDVLMKRNAEWTHYDETLEQNLTRAHAKYGYEPGRLGGELEMLKRQLDMGMYEPNSINQISLLPQPDARFIDKALDYFDHGFRGMNNAVEVQNRAVLALTAYRLERKAGGDQLKSMRAADDAVFKGAGNYAAWNSPPMFENQNFRFAMQFKKYPQRIISNYIAAMVGTSKAVNDLVHGRTVSAESRVQARQLAMMFGMQSMVAGVFGTYLEPAAMGVNALNLLGATDTNWGDIQAGAYRMLSKELGPGAAEIVAHGLFRLAGVDVSNRLSHSDLAFFGDPKSTKPQDIKTSIGSLAMGAPGSTLLGYLDGLQNLSKGIRESIAGSPDTAWRHYSQAIRDFSFLRTTTDLWDAYRWASGDASTRAAAGAPLGPQYNAGQMAVQALGFMPAERARGLEQRAAETRATAQLAAGKKVLLDRYAQADASVRPGIEKQIREWNDSHPAYERITSNDRVQAVSRRRTQEKRPASEYAMSISKRMQPMHREYSQIYNTGG